MSRHECVRTARTHRLADRRRKVGVQLRPRRWRNVCERLVEARLPLWRVGIFVRTLHPEIFGRNFIWRPGAEVEIGSVDFSIQDSPGFHAARSRIVFQQGSRFAPASTIPHSSRFPIIEDMSAEGVTDYVALPVLVHRRRRPRLELDHEAAGRLYRRTADGAATRDAAAGAHDRNHQPAPHRHDACSTPMSATVPASGSSPARSAAAITRP